MTDRDNHLWLQLWRDRRTDFHQEKVNQLLSRFWPGLDLSEGSRIFVPLCGKSLDMIWLAQRGHRVVGVELSPIAVRAFFKENGLRPSKYRSGLFTVWWSGRISIFCGDYFALKKSDLGEIDTVYDRAALTALPEDIRKLYIAQLKLIVSDSTNVFLLTTEDAAVDDTAEQALGIDQEIAVLYSDEFDINLAYVESAYEDDPESLSHALRRAEYKVYKLTGKSSLRSATSA